HEAAGDRHGCRHATAADNQPATGKRKSMLRHPGLAEASPSRHDTKLCALYAESSLRRTGFLRRWRPMIRILFVGDVVGRPGRELLCSRAKALRAELGLTFIIANAENAAAGAGITGGIVRELLAADIDAITLGDHIWDQKGFDAEIGTFDRVCRPANLPARNPGRTSLLIERDSVRLGILTVLGRQYLNLKSSCPFVAADEEVKKLQEAGADLIFVEVHAEATSEKIALGRYLD